MTDMKTPQEYGVIGARRRWGPPRRLNIGDLSPEQRQRILDLIEAERAKAPKVES